MLLRTLRLLGGIFLLGLGIATMWGGFSGLSTGNLPIGEAALSMCQLILGLLIFIWGYRVTGWGKSKVPQSSEPKTQIPKPRA